VVAECDDSWLNDARRMQVEHEDVVAAYDAAMASRGSSSPPEEGAVGSGTGMSCLGFKGGIGTASRVVGEHTVAVLLMTNFGAREELVVSGVPVGRRLGPVASTGLTGPTDERKPAGSCIGIVVTDAPVDGASCARLARRVGLGLARAGSVAHHGSGEIFMAFGTGMRMDRDGKPDGIPVMTGRALDPLFAAVVEASEEAVLNSMFTAPTVTGRDGNTSESANGDAVLGTWSRLRSTDEAPRSTDESALSTDEAPRSTDESALSTDEAPRSTDDGSSPSTDQS
jgi:D-aminopeptidase